MPQFHPTNPLVTGADPAVLETQQQAGRREPGGRHVTAPAADLQAEGVPVTHRQFDSVDHGFTQQASRDRPRGHHDDRRPSPQLLRLTHPHHTRQTAVCSRPIGRGCEPNCRSGRSCNTVAARARPCRDRDVQNRLIGVAPTRVLRDDSQPRVLGRDLISYHNGQRRLHGDSGKGMRTGGSIQARA
jgi:hypothetical protein